MNTDDKNDNKTSSGSPIGEPFRHLIAEAPPPKRRGRLMTRLRSYFLTGLVIAAPISITVYVTWWFIGFIDTWF